MERRLAAIFASDVVGYSRLMGADETGTLEALRANRRDVVDPAFGRHRGRVIKLMGDGTLTEFASVIDAVACAVEIQRAAAAHNAAVPTTRPIELRIGIHLGDVIVDGGDLYGDGVNIAARLERVAETGGICVSRQVYDQVNGKLPLTFRSLGAQTLKNIERPIETYAVSTASPIAAVQLEQRIAFCRAADGVRLAYATVGSGPPIVKTANWINHLEYDWESPLYRGLFRELANGRRLVRYDARGNGLSDWDAERIDFDMFVSDLETVVEAARLDRFPLFGLSQGCAVAIAYAVRHPDRVTHLILHGGYAVGPLRRSAAEAERARAMAHLMRDGWTSENPAIRQMFASIMFPEGTKEVFDRFNEMQRASISPENAYRFREAVGNIDIRELLPLVEAPTLITHSRGDAVAPYELGRAMAADIPGARFVTLQSKNHVLLEDEPAHVRQIEEIENFLAA
jgi:class 3 adenylate cyclase/pimeloyl-ACP methyl ester carboxylesterase